MKRLLLIIFLGALLLNYGKVFSNNKISAPNPNNLKYSFPDHSLYAISGQSLSLEMSDFSVNFGQGREPEDMLNISNFSASHLIHFIKLEQFIFGLKWFTDLPPPVLS